MADDRLSLRPSSGPVIRQFKRRRRRGSYDWGLILLLILTTPLAWLALALALYPK